MTNTIEEIGKANCILVIGSNTTEGHPIIGSKIREAVRKGSTLIVADPLKIKLCESAHLWLNHRPGTDVALFMGMARVIVEEGLADSSFIEERTENFEEFKKSLNFFDLQRVEEITGVDREKIRNAARIYATHKPGTILYAMGITQHSHGTDNVFALANLVLITGNIGKPSTGLNPLRGQNNVQGACDMGNLPNVYPGYQRIVDPQVREKFSSAWGAELNETPGLTMPEILPAVTEGRIKALYLVGSDPALNMACSKVVRSSLASAEFIILQDLFFNESSKYAHVILPAVSFAEKEGTFTNTERRVQKVNKVIPPVGNARTDLEIICELANEMGANGFDYKDFEEVLKEASSLVPSYGGITYERLEKGGIQWPCPTPEHPGTPYLYKEKFLTPSGKGKLTPLDYKPSAEHVTTDYPFILTTKRSLYHYHATLTCKVEGLNTLMKEELLEINPQDAETHGIKNGELVRVISRRGEVVVKTKITGISPPGLVSMTFHFTETPTNILTNLALDPTAKTPETKVTAVRIEKYEKGEMHGSTC